MYTRGRPKSIFLFVAVSQNANENEISFTTKIETKSKMDIHFQPKYENESHLIILVFFSFSYIQSPSQTYNALPIPRPVSPFFAGGPCWRVPLSSCTRPRLSLWHFSRWHFNPWTVCFFSGLLLPSKSNFPQSIHCALLTYMWPIK